MREDDRESRCCACARAVAIALTLWNGQVAVNQAWKRRVVQTRISWQTCLLSFVSTRESCIEKVQPARDEEFSNSDMLSTMIRSCTLYIHAHLPSVHSPDQV